MIIWIISAFLAGLFIGAWWTSYCTRSSAKAAMQRWEDEIKAKGVSEYLKGKRRI